MRKNGTGYKRIIVSEEIHQEIKKNAKEAKRTIGEYIEYLVAMDKAA